MKSERFRCYGIDTNAELKAMIKYVSMVLSLGADQGNLADFLTNIAKAESAFGTILYNPDRGFGLGVFQFDKAGWNRCKNYLAKHQNISTKIYALLGNYNRFEYEDLKENIKLATIMARVYLLTIPEPIPATLEGQARQWKQYYNTYAGKGTIDGFMQKSAMVI